MGWFFGGLFIFLLGLGSLVSYKKKEPLDFVLKDLMKW